jgi:hypothetical protein
MIILSASCLFFLFGFFSLIYLFVFSTSLLCLVCKNLSLTVSEKHRLRIAENRALKTIFGPEDKNVTGGWTELRNEEFHNLNSLQYVTRMTQSRLNR